MVKLLPRAGAVASQLGNATCSMKGAGDVDDDHELVVGVVEGGSHVAAVLGEVLIVIVVLVMSQAGGQVHELSGCSAGWPLGLFLPHSSRFIFGRGS